jgi:hypothetical protein
MNLFFILSLNEKKCIFDGERGWGWGWVEIYYRFVGRPFQILGYKTPITHLREVLEGLQMDL